MQFCHLRQFTGWAQRINAFSQCRIFCTKSDTSPVSFRLIGSGACGDPSSFYLQAQNARYDLNEIKTSEIFF